MPLASPDGPPDGRQALDATRAGAAESVRRTRRFLSAANRALVRADDEVAFLESICRSAIDEGGFRYAWVGFREDDEAGTIRPVAHAGQENGYLADLPLTWHGAAAASDPTGTAVGAGQTVVVRDIASGASGEPWRERAIERGYASAAALPIAGASGVLGSLTIYSPEPEAFATEEVALLEEMADDICYGIEALRTKAAGVASEAELRRLAMAVDQSAESVILTDLAGTIEYVNPAFERISGYSSAEVLGRNPRILQGGRHDRAFYEVMWETLAAGRSWVGEIVNRRKDRSFYTEEAIISPIRDSAGTTTSYVAVKRDVTAERGAEAREAVRARERAQIAQALATLEPRATGEETADAICRRIVQLPEAAAAVVLVFDPDGTATPIGAAAREGDVLVRTRLGEARAQHLRTRAAAGPWIETWEQATGHSFGKAFRALGIRAFVYAPIRIGQEAVGLLEVGSSEPDASVRLVERLPAIVEFASISSAVLGPVIASRATRSRFRRRIADLLAARAFHPLFQPIVDLESREVVGYEALTRFDSGQQPDLCFADAWSAGLGPELALATLGAAVAAATELPPATWLNLNVAPRELASPERLRAILWSADRPLVLELTEHEVIEDYDAVRDAIKALGLDLRVAVDDAGAGVANFGHIIDIRPDFVKLDISLVRHVNANLGRQAMVVGMRHFARTAGCRLIAEGIETDQEAATLFGLGVEFGQGYLFGRPEPAAAWAGSNGHRPRTDVPVSQRARSKAVRR